MTTLRTVLLIFALLCVPGSVGAADWTTEDGGSTSCSTLRVDGVCYLTGITEDSSSINIRSCEAWSITVFGTGASIMPQVCNDKSCTKAEDLLATALTGDSPNTFVTSEIAWDFIRIDWTSGGAAPDVHIKCGR